MSRDHGQGNGEVTPHVAGLYIHPLKSAAGVRVDRLELDAMGAVHDRRWLLVDGDGVAITQRRFRRLAHVRASIPEWTRGSRLALSAPTLADITVDVEPDAPRRRVRVWEADMTALDAGDVAAAWCADAIGAPCRLVYMAPESHRPLQARFAGPVSADGRQVAFSDGAPLLVLSTGSVAALNDRMAEIGHDAIPIQRFRPNVIVEGVGPHEEDRWQRIAISGVEIGVGSTCARCVMTTIDQRTLAPDVEPLRTMSTYRRLGDGVMFGVNVTHVAPGTIDDGAAVAILETREAPL